MTKKFNYETSLLEYGEVNSGFAKVKISVLTHEQVANGTKFTKEVIDKRASGLNYLPVIGEFKEDNNDFGTHGGKVEITDDGFNIIETTKPYGVVIADSYRWEDVQLKNGETVPYLVCSAYLWIDRYPELNVLYEGKMNNQSMEIKVLDGKFNEDNWVYEVNDFEFSALTILGSDVKPAFNEAKVDVNFAKQDFKLQYEEMVTALNKYLEENHQEKEVNEKMTKVEEQFEEVQEEVVEVEVEEQDTTTGEHIETEEVENATEEVNEDVALEEEDETVDVQVEEVEEVKEEEFAETEKEVDNINYQELYENLKVEHEGLLEVVEELKQYKSEREYQDEMSVKMSKVESFRGRLSDEDLQPIIENIDTYSAEQVEDKCFAILGRKNITYSIETKEYKNKVANFSGQFTNTRTWLDELK